MPNHKTLIQFSSILDLWHFAQRIGAVYIEINTRSKTLLCECSQEDLALLSKYNGIIIETTAKQSSER